MDASGNIGSDEEARAISQHLLDVTGAAYRDRDYAAFAPHFVVPGDVHSFGGLRLVKDLADLHDLFTEVMAYFDQIGLTSLERDCIAAEFDGPDRVKATHVTRMMCGSSLLSSPFPAFSLLRRIEGRWMIASSQYATDDERLAKALTRSWEERPCR
ncbi:hypothetical protein [Vannielia litorea]|uniref:hypothetical protein n=1 Tax=Vannielia litorea TaxID=1217970 RepID=UPI001C958876|nr:hypothetical protein [Vannielia litorea]MBY6050036.1 hypothetical protein [Vannielia litorea]MBY6077450.1 hypothetical protein [Vannielia litorea]